MLLDVGLGVLVGGIVFVLVAFVALWLGFVAGIVVCALCLKGTAVMVRHRRPRRWYHVWVPVGLGIVVMQAGLGFLLGQLVAERWIAAAAYLLVGAATVPVGGALLIGGTASAVRDWRREPNQRSTGDWLVVGAGILGLSLLAYLAWSWFV